MSTARRQPPPEKLGAAANRIYDGAPSRQPELPHTSRKDDGGAADRSSGLAWMDMYGIR